MESSQKIKKIIASSVEVKQQILEDIQLQKKVEESVQAITNCFRNNGRLWLCGNGGSAADAQHIAAEFTGRFYKDRKALPAEALHVNTSYLTSVGNDYSFDEIYSRMLEGVAQKGDLLIAISTSGNSNNIVNAVKAAKKKEIQTIGFTGKDGGSMTTDVDILLNIPADDTPRIQECHILIGHIICELVEENLFNA